MHAFLSFLKVSSLVSRNDEFRIHAEELFGINGIAREKIVERLIFIHGLETSMHTTLS